MAITEIPLESNAYYDFTITLESLEWLITIRWNDQAEGWYMDLQGITDTSIDFRGLRLVGGVDLLRPYAITQLGQMVVIDTEGYALDPDFDGLGDRYILAYYDKTEDALF